MSLRDTNGRRQPSRAVRSSTTRPLNYYARPFNYRSSTNNANEHDPASDEAPGFYPAITFFTDGLAALPKEIMRQFTLLKETEGKAYQPDQSISDLLDAFNSLPPAPHQRIDQPPNAFLGLSMNNSTSGSANASVVDGAVPAATHLIPDSMQLDGYAEQRALIYREMQVKLREMTLVLDEKNMVLATANETVNRQLERLDSAMPFIEGEISEEARLGSTTHWALPHMKDVRRANGVAPERARRDAHNVSNLANAAAAIEHDAAASRSEARREAIAAKRSRNHHVDSDFDTERPAAKKVHTTKSKKLQDERMDSRGVAPPAQKRRRADKPTGVAMERTASTATNGRSVPTREGPGAPEPSRKKKALPTQPMSKKRPGAVSPSIASSPTRGAFGALHRDNSPAGAGMQRVASSRGRQNSALSGLNEHTRGRPGSANAQVRSTNGAPTDKSEAKSALLNNQRKAQNGLDIQHDGHEDASASKVLEPVADPPRATSQLKREETEAIDEGEPGGAPKGARSRGGSRPSKPGTPVAGSATDAAAATAMSRSRSTRGAHNFGASASTASSPQIRPSTSPRKGAKKSTLSRKSSISSLDAAEAPGAESAAEAEGDGEGGNDEIEDTYCRCGGVSYGDMVACDNENCPREWFHLECVGLKKMPGKNDKWYCSPECREEAKRLVGGVR